MNGDYFSLLKAGSKPRYRQKLDLVGLRYCPYRLPADIWSDNPVQWPEIKYPDIYDYVINIHGKSERATVFGLFIWVFRLFISEEAHRRVTNNDHKKTDSWVLSNHWFLIALKASLIVIASHLSLFQIYNCGAIV